MHTHRIIIKKIKYTKNDEEKSKLMISQREGSEAAKTLGIVS
jgi:hypothetical protein